MRIRSQLLTALVAFLATSRVLLPWQAFLSTLSLSLQVLAHPWFTMDPAPAALGGLVPAVAAASARRADAASRIPPLETVLLHSHSSSER